MKTIPKARFYIVGFTTFPEGWMMHALKICQNHVSLYVAQNNGIKVTINLVIYYFIRTNDSMGFFWGVQ